MQYLKIIIHRIAIGLPPTLLCTLALASGILYQLLKLTGLATLLLCIGIGELLHHIHRWPRITAWLTVVFLSCWASLRLASQQAHRLSVTHNIPYGLCTVEGTVVDTGPSKSTLYPYYMHVTAKRIVSLYNKKKTSPTPVTMRIALKEPLPTHAQGAIVELSHIACMKPLTPEQDYYLIKNKLHSSGKITKQSIIRVLQQPDRPSLFSKLSMIRQHIIDTARICFSPKTFILISEMFFGFSSGYDDCHHSIHHIFNCWGLSHLLARSGLHLVMFIVLFGLALSMIPLPFLWKHLIILFSIFVYVILSWPSISFIRATSMIVWYGFCLGIKAAPHPLHIIACITSAVLLYQPWYFIGLDFQLSFALAFALALINHSNKTTKL